MPLSLDSLKGGPSLETFQRADGLFDWRLKGGQGQKVCGSLQGFTSESDAKRAALRARELFMEVTDVRSA
jgi:uncharacterized protein YegP (UPF0339 family)